jgi:hypothetical protein
MLNYDESEEDNDSVNTDDLMGMSPYYMILEKFFKYDNKSVSHILHDLNQNVSELRKDIASLASELRKK